MQIPVKYIKSEQEILVRQELALRDFFKIVMSL